MGQMGQYFQRVYATRFGGGRDWVCELVITDPVIVGVAECLADIEDGVS